MKSCKSSEFKAQKGGSGKTMLAKHLAVEAERAGDGPVFLIDTDPQRQPHRLAYQTGVRDSPARVEIPFKVCVKA